MMGGMGGGMGSSKAGNNGQGMATESVMGLFDAPDFMGNLAKVGQGDSQVMPAKLGSTSMPNTGGGGDGSLAGQLSKVFASNANGQASPSNPIPMTQYTAPIGPQNNSAQPLPADSISGPSTMYDAAIGPQNNSSSPLLANLLKKQYLSQQ